MKEILLTFFIIFGIILLTSVISAFDKRLCVREYSIKSKKISKTLDSLKILLISDMHMQIPPELLSVVKNKKPDIITLCGDILDERRQTKAKYDDMLETLAKLAEIAPTYSVSGNHDLMYPEYDKFVDDISRIGIIQLDDSSTFYEKNKSRILICGIKDFFTKSRDKSFKLKENAPKSDNNLFSIMLFHRATFAKEAVDFLGCDLTLMGHVHGGQWRIPFGRGILSPERKLFPKYDGGKYEFSNKTVIVCRGNGSAPYIPRIFNPPEIALITVSYDK